MREQTGRFIPEKSNIWRDCVDGYYDWVREHIAEGAPLNDPDHCGDPPLLLAAGNGHLACVKVLFINLLPTDCEYDACGAHAAVVLLRSDFVSLSLSLSLVVLNELLLLLLNQGIDDERVYICVCLAHHVRFYICACMYT